MPVSVIPKDIGDDVGDRGAEGGPIRAHAVGEVDGAYLPKNHGGLAAR